MTVLVNSAEGGTNGTTVTAANSGGASGNAFDTVTIGSGATLIFDNTHAAHGTLAYKLATGATAANVFTTWSSSLTPTSVSQVWFRLYLYFTANPATSFRVWSCFSVGPITCASVVVTTSGNLRFTNKGGTTIFTQTAAIPLNQWFRIEGFVIGSGTVGQVNLSLYDSMDSPVATESETSTATQNTNGAISGVEPGESGTTIANLGPYWMDDIGVSTTGFLGPAGTTPQAGSTRKGPPGAVKGRLASILVPPPAVVVPSVPAPFFAPHTLLRGATKARKGALAGLVAPPPVIHPSVPAPFFAPHMLLAGQRPVMTRTRTAYVAAPPPVPQPPPLHGQLPQGADDKPHLKKLLLFAGW